MVIGDPQQVYVLKQVNICYLSFFVVVGTQNFVNDFYVDLAAIAAQKVTRLFCPTVQKMSAFLKDLYL